MAAERPLQKKIEEFANALRNTEGTRSSAREAYKLAGDIFLRFGSATLFARGGPREIGSFGGDLPTVFNSREISYRDSQRVDIVSGTEVYAVFLRETFERPNRSPFPFRAVDKPGIDMLVVDPENGERARLLLSFEEERVVGGPDRTPLDAPATLQALEVLKDFSARLEAANTAKDSAATSAS